MDASAQPSSATLVYLYSGQIVPAPKGIFPMAALDPLNGTKLDLKQMVMKTYTAAIMDLVESGRISLEVVAFKKFLGKDNALVPRVNVAPAGKPADTASLFLSLFADASKPEQRRVREMVIRVVGGRGSTDYPWFLALAPVLNEAVNAGYVSQDPNKPGALKAMFRPTEALTRVYPVAERIASLNGAGEAALARLAAFERGLGEMAVLLRKEIENGVDACKEQPDGD